MFGGTWGDDAKLFGDDGSISNFFKYGLTAYDKKNSYADASEMNFFNKVMTGLGVAASVYTLGTTGAKNSVGEKKFITIAGYTAA